MGKKSSGKVKRLNSIFEKLGTDTQYEPPPCEGERRPPASRKDNDCGKVCFSSESECNRAINRRLNIGANMSKLRSYFCKECNAWHMSSSITR